MEESNIQNREQLRMKRAGIVPRRVWNALVDLVWQGQVTSVVGGRVKKSRNGTVIEVTPRAWPSNNHPFQILVSYELNGESRQYRLRCQAGRVSAPQWKEGQLVNSERIVGYTSSAGCLLGDEFGPSATPGYIALSASTTYGVWCMVQTAEASEDKPENLTGQYLALFDTYGSTAEIAVSTTNTDPEDAEAQAEADGSALAFYLGKVTTSNDGTATVKQYRRSDIVCPNSALPEGLISTDANNSLVAGTDGALWLRVVSADSDNDLSTGSDGGAYYNAP